MIDLSVLGTLRPDGSILLDNTNIAFREAMTGDYNRIRQTVDQKFELGELGYVVVDSSFISAVGVFGDNLRIRFHNGSVYEYYGFANRFDAMMRALSKGQYFNRNIRPTKNFAKLGNIDFSGGNVMALEDNEVFTQIETQDFARVVMMLQGKEMIVTNLIINGIEHQKFDINGFIFYRPTQV